MAVYLKPCHGCPIPAKVGDDRCLAKREEMRQKVSGLGLSSAKFNCEVLADHFKPGTRLTINTPVLRYGRYDDDGYNVSHVEVAATVLGFDGQRFQCVVDLEEMVRAQEQDQSETVKDPKTLIFRKPLLPARVVRFLDEPIRPVCQGGNVVVEDGKCDQGSCLHCYPMEYDDGDFF